MIHDRLARAVLQEHERAVLVAHPDRVVQRRVPTLMVIPMGVRVRIRESPWGFVRIPTKWDQNHGQNGNMVLGVNGLLEILDLGRKGVCFMRYFGLTTTISPQTDVAPQRLPERVAGRLFTHRKAGGVAFPVNIVSPGNSQYCATKLNIQTEPISRMRFESIF